LPVSLLYQRSVLASSAVQRNRGAEASQGHLIFFLDDDVVLEPDFIAEIVRVFEDDTEGTVGGVSGTIHDTIPAPPSRLNLFLLRLLGGHGEGNYAGQLVGPAISFFPEDRLNCVQGAEWLNAGGVAYRREIFLSERFWESFSGYSFLEDVHLSARVGRKYRLLNTTRARLVHRALGANSHTDWAEFGESMIMNRHAVTMHVLERRRLRDYARLFGYELLYCTAGQIKNPTRPWRANLQLLRGKLRGVGKLLMGKSPHRPYFGQAPASAGGIRALRRAFEVQKADAFEAAKTPERADGDQ
jgi:GT2 family glycosyltransferase